MNAKSNISDWQHQENRNRATALRAQGYRIEVSSQGYQIWDATGKYLGGASTRNKPHGRYAEANIRENLSSALSCVR